MPSRPDPTPSRAGAAPWPAGGPALSDRHPLSGLRVVSMAEQFPGPLCCLLLADLGADVIQVERPGGGDPSRALPPLYAALNRNKRSVALDIRAPDDLARARALIRAADVFLEGFRPGKLAQRGLGWEALSAESPRLIYVSISAFGADGPLRDRPAHDLTCQGVAGALDERIRGAVTGAAPTLLLGDVTAAYAAAVGILAALRGRDVTGRGTWIDCAMTDAAASAMAPFAAMALARAAEPGAPDAPPPQAEPAYDAYRCADDRWLTLSIAHEDEQWRRLAARLEFAPEIVGLDRPARTARRGELAAAIADRLAARPRAHWAALFDADDLMWGVANRLEDLPDDPQLRAREMILRDPSGAWTARAPLRFSAYRPVPLAPAPALGAHQTDLDAGPADP